MSPAAVQVEDPAPEGEDCPSKGICNTSASPSILEQPRWGKVRNSGKELHTVLGRWKAPQPRGGLIITFLAHRKHLLKM